MAKKAIKNIILLTLPDGKKETWGSLSEVCEKKDLKVNTLYQKKFPFTVNGIKFEKLPFREENK